MSPSNFFRINSSLGTIFVISTSEGISSVIFGRGRLKHFKNDLNGAKLTEGGYAEKSGREIQLYLEGKLKEFQTKLDLSSGTPFQVSVWRELLKIPYGKVTTYGEIAKKVNNPHSARAVGNAVGANPIPIIVPCHRVVATNGLGGYSCGIEIKRKLLRNEGVIQ
ncbi:MAG: methylated-DNA--[protein]-cysteine S-methyltransferase [Deltaproteobacteria bacterium]|nr:methylated-DNA--[protein]-cysteine S-methyltransferase [Deltaproteobacteria bacterium]